MVGKCGRYSTGSGEESGAQ